MTKELLTIEFRYHDKPKGDWDSEHKNKTITLGVFDTLEEAIVEGNKAMEVFEKHFKLHTFPDGRNAKNDRFSKSGGCFGMAQRLITPLAYLRCPFDFYAKITTLTYSDVEETILEVLKSIERYKEHKAVTQED
jgi:hypothetical protein